MGRAVRESSRAIALYGLVVLVAFVSVGLVLQAPVSASFPVTIEHKHGRVTISKEPTRVVTIGFNEEDFALALGVTPVGVREWLGEFAFQSRPWKPADVAGVEFPTVGGLELELERIAALGPDLILGLYAGLTPQEYGILSRLAPTVVQPAEYPDWAIPWDEQTILTGRALGREEKARELVAEVKNKYVEARRAHPEFEGKTAAFASFSQDGFWIFEADDIRTQFLVELGFELPEVTGGLSKEQAFRLDQDVVIAVLTEREREQFLKDPLYGQLNVVKEGRVIYLDGWNDPMAAAIGYNSPLSLPYLLDEIVPKLADAVGGGTSGQGSGAGE